MNAINRENARATLSTLSDIGGIQGSFVIGARGELLAKDLPAVFQDGLFTVVGARILRLFESLEATSEELSLVTMRFSEHKLHVRRAPFGFVCALSDLDVNSSALSMALTLVTRRLEAEFAASFPSEPSATTSDVTAGDPRRTTLPSADMEHPTETPPRPLPPPPPVSSRRAVMYRGRRVE